MKTKLLKNVLASLSCFTITLSTMGAVLLSSHFKANSEAVNVLAGKAGIKVAAPGDDYSKFVRYGVFGSESTSGAMTKLTDGITDAAKASASKIQYLNTTTLKVGVMFDLGGLYDISGATLYLPNNAVYGMDLLKGMNVYVGTDPTTLCTAENSIGTVTDNQQKTISITADTPRLARYAVFLISDMGGENNAYIAEIELYGSASSSQQPVANANLTSGKTPQIWLANSDFSTKVNGSSRTSGIAGFTDGLYPSAPTQIYGDLAGGGQFSTHVIQFDLGASYDISKVNVPYYLSDGSTTLLNSWDVYLSDNSETLLDASNRIVGKTSSQLRVMTAQITGRTVRYVAVVLQAPADVYVTKVFEVEVYGKEAAPLPPDEIPGQNLLSGKSGVKVLTPTSDYSLYARHTLRGEDTNWSKLTDTAVDETATTSAVVYAAGKGSFKTGVFYDLGGLYDIHGAKIYLPSGAGTNLVQGVRVYTGTDLSTLCEDTSLLVSATGNTKQLMNLAASQTTAARYVVFLFTETGADSNARISELELYGTTSSSQQPAVKENLALGKTPQISLTNQDLTTMVSGMSQTSNIAGYTDNLYSSTVSQISGNLAGGGQYTTHVILLDLGKSCDISRVNVPYRLFDSQPQMWSVYLGAAQDTLFTDANKVAGQTQANTYTMAVKFTAKTARYVAIVLQLPEGSYVSKLYEVEIYGVASAGSGDPTPTDPVLSDTPNLVQGMKGNKVLVPVDEYSLFTKGVWSASDTTPENMTDGTLDKMSTLYGDSVYKDTHKTGVLYELASPSAITGAEVYLPSDHAAREVRVYAGSDMTTLGEPSTLLESKDVTATDTKITITASTPVAAKYILFLFSKTSSTSRSVKILELKVLGSTGAQVPAEKTNVARGLRPSVYFAVGSDLANLAEAGSSQVSSVGKMTYTDGLYPTAATEMWASAEGNSHVIALRLDGVYAISQVNVAYNLWGNLPSAWDVYLSEYDTDLFAAENKITGKTATDGVKTCVRFPQRTARYIAIVITPQSGKTSKIYEVEAWGVAATASGLPPKNGPKLPAANPDDIDLVVPPMGPVDADGFVRTPNYQKSVIHTLSPIFVGVASTTDYNAAYVASHTTDAFTMLTDGIIGDSTGKSQRIEFWGYKAAQNYKAIIIFDMGKNYDLSSVSVYSNHSTDPNNVIKSWDVYAAATRKDLMAKAEKTVGKQGYTDSMDKTVTVKYKEVRFLMLILEPDDKVNGALRIPEIEAFGELSANQPSDDDDTVQKDQFVDITDETTGTMVRIHFASESDAFNFVVQLHSQIAADESKQSLFMEGLGNTYYVYDIAQLALSDMLGDAVDIGGRKMTVYLPVPKSLNAADINLAYRNSFGDVELLDTTVENDRLVFDTYELNDYAFVKANYSGDGGYNGIPSENTGENLSAVKAMAYVMAAVTIAAVITGKRKRNLNER